MIQVLLIPLRLLLIPIRGLATEFRAFARELSRANRSLRELGDELRGGKSVSVHIESYGLKRAQQMPGSVAEAYRRAVRRAINRTADQVKVEASRLIRARYNLKASLLREEIKVQRALPSGPMVAVVLAEGRRSLPLKEFGAREIMRRGKRGQRAGVSVMVLKGQRKVLKTAFAAGGEAQIFERLGRSRLPIKKLSTIGVPSMFAQKEVQRDLRAFADQALEKNIRYEIEYELRILRQKFGGEPPRDR